MARIAWITSGLAAVLLVYNLRNAVWLSQVAKPARSAPRPVQTFRPASNSVPAARAPVGRSRAQTDAAVGGAPHIQPTVPSVCAPRSRGRAVPVRPRPLNYVASRGCGPPSDGVGLCDALSQAGVGPGSAVLLLVAAEGDEAALARFVQLARGVGVSGHLLVAALDAEAAAAARALSPAPDVWDASSELDPGLPPPARKWALAALLLSRGVSVLHVSVEAALLGDPFLALSHDADVEAASESSHGLAGWLGGSAGERGTMRVANDAIMGWSQMAESYQARRYLAGWMHLLAQGSVASDASATCPVLRLRQPCPPHPFADPAPDASLLVRRRHERVARPRPPRRQSAAGGSIRRGRHGEPNHKTDTNPDPGPTEEGSLWLRKNGEPNPQQ